MTPGNITETNQLSLDELKQLGGAAGPCITILQPLLPAANESKQNKARIKAAVQNAQRILGEKNIGGKPAHELLDPLFNLTDEVDFSGSYQGVAIFRSPGIIKYFLVSGKLPESVTVADHFLVRPLLPVVDAERTFYVLALSQKHIRLLRCANHSAAVEVPLPDSVPKTLHEDMQSEKPDHVQDNRSTGGPSTGAMKGVTFSTNTDRETKDEYLLHFYQHVDRGIRELLKDTKAPLVLAGVDYEVAIYKKINSYPRLAEDAVQGAPDGLKGGELHKRALEAVQSYFESDLKKALTLFEEQMGGDRATKTVKDIVRGAYEGRVLYLLIAENAEYSGNFDEATHNVQGHKHPMPGDEDLLNAAGLQTILHGGHVFVVPASKVPDGAPAVAVLRY